MLLKEDGEWRPRALIEGLQRDLLVAAYAFASSLPRGAVVQI